MKLEIRHLAPYLPYELNILITESGEIVKMLSLDAILFRNQVAIETNRGSFGSMWFKPILRPLSDLTKEIKYDLSTYAFIDLFEIGECDGCVYEFEHGNIKTINSISSIAQNSSYHDINYLPHAVVNMMIEYRFDVFGLIDAGLAIDINTLTN